MWQGEFTTVLVGINGNQGLDVALAKRRFENETVLANFAEVGLDEFSGLMELLIAGADKLEQFTGEGQVNSDDRPRIEYMRRGVGGDNALGFLLELREGAASP